MSYQNKTILRGTTLFKKILKNTYNITYCCYNALECKSILISGKYWPINEQVKIFFINVYYMQSIELEGKTELFISKSSLRSNSVVLQFSDNFCCFLDLQKHFPGTHIIKNVKYLFFKFLALPSICSLRIRIFILFNICIVSDISSWYRISINN